MIGDTRGQYENLPIAVRKLVSDASDRFRQASRGGTMPRLDEFLRQCPEAHRPRLFRELLFLEILCRRQRNEQPVADSYVAAFPSLTNEIRAVFAELGDLQDTARTQAATPQVHGLNVRCPHCHDSVELSPYASLVDMRCPSCSNSFSIVGETECGEEMSSWLGHFELLERIGVGGFGTVWKARDTVLDRLVAIKVPSVGQLGAKEAEMFVREARAAAQLRHSNIVPVFEVGRAGDSLFIVSELIHGVTLKDWMERQRPSTQSAVEICIAIAEALHHAHEQGVIHRDLKPANIMVDRDGNPHVLDFGLARRETGELTMTTDGQVLGTPAYMSPEQAQGNAHFVDRRTDIYSLGVILFEFLTGERPFRGNPKMLIHQLLHEEAPSPRKLNGMIARDLETICCKCLEKSPMRRYRTADELRRDLESFRHGRPIAAKAVTPFGRLWRTLRYQTLASITAAGAVMLFSASVLVLWLCMGMTYFATGLHQTADKGGVLLQLGASLVVLCGPMIWIGVGTIGGKVTALWAGLFVLILDNVAAVACLVGWVDLEMVTTGGPDGRLKAYSLLLAMSVVGLAIYIACLYSYYRSPAMGRCHDPRSEIAAQTGTVDLR